MPVLRLILFGVPGLEWLGTPGLIPPGSGLSVLLTGMGWGPVLPGSFRGHSGGFGPGFVAFAGYGRFSSGGGEREGVRYVLGVARELDRSPMAFPK